MYFSFRPSLPLVALALGGLAVVGLAATFELPIKPSPEFQNLMRSNASLVDLSASPTQAGATGGGGRETNIESRVQPIPGSKTLRDMYRDKEFDGLAKGAALLQANYEQQIKFWTEKKADDAAALAKTGLKAAIDMQEAAKTQNAKGISNAQTTIERTCRDCHTIHRVIMLTDSSFQIRIAADNF
jgi:hypothetical protein